MSLPLYLLKVLKSWILLDWSRWFQLSCLTLAHCAFAAADTDLDVLYHWDIFIHKSRRGCGVNRSSVVTIKCRFLIWKGAVRFILLGSGGIYWSWHWQCLRVSQANLSHSPLPAQLQVCIKILCMNIPPLTLKLLKLIKYRSSLGAVKLDELLTPDRRHMAPLPLVLPITRAPPVAPLYWIFTQWTPILPETYWAIELDHIANTAQSGARWRASSL